MDHSPNAKTLILIGLPTKSGFTVIAEIIRCNTLTKEINHASALTQYFNEKFILKIIGHEFSAMMESRLNAI